MLFIIFYILVPLVYSFNLETFLSTISKEKGNFPVVVKTGVFDEKLTYSINSSVIYLLVYKDSNTLPLRNPARITTESLSASETYPLLIVVQQPKSVVSWQIPSLIGSEETSMQQFQRTSRTLCPSYSKNSTDIDESEWPLIIMISCSSPENVDFSVNVTHTDFYIELDKELTVTVAPSESLFYSFVFPDDLSSALLKLSSENDVCMSMSIQNFSCPVYDQEDDLKYRGYWETVTRKGGMMLTREAFPKRLFVVFVVHADDEDCTGHAGSLPNREKKVTFSITRSISYKEYLVAMITVVTVFSVTYLLALFFALFFSKKNDSVSFDDDVACIIGSTEVDAASFTKNIYPRSSSVISTNHPSTSTEVSVYRETSLKIFLNLYDLSKEAHEVLKAKSNLYFWNLLTIAVFYSLPVVQLVFTYQKVLDQSGNQDLCYYNFLCSHRLSIISDFNHIFSNIGYILLGMLFLLIVYSREKLEEKKDTGIPQHYGLFYTLGAALIMEGVLSACYHFCPNHSNFQFDTSFMYILAVISMLKIYQSRHPDINASAYSAFGILAFLIFLGMYGVLNGSDYFYYCFTVIHVITCLYLSAQIYYMGEWNLDRRGRFFMIVITPVRNREDNWWRPLYPSRLVLLILGNICNWALIWVRLYSRLGDFATYLLAILMANLLLYFMFYILMKLFNGERILFYTSLYIVASLICWAAAVYFFIHKSISWKLTPAESRTYNQPCVLFDFYDKHDIWHFLSATSMFFSFMVLLTLDDDLADVHRSQIAVF